MKRQPRKELTAWIGRAVRSATRCRPLTDEDKRRIEGVFLKTLKKLGKLK